MNDLIDATIAAEREMRPEIERTPLEHRESARNLAHYMAVRRRDIRALQIELGHLGLSSLGRLEAHVRAGLESVLLALSRLAGEPYPDHLVRARPVFFEQGDEALTEHTNALFGPPRHADAVVRIVVTLPSEASRDYPLVLSLAAAGMDVARINAAHDEADDWRRMADNVRKAGVELGRPISVLVDLAGPKIRTGGVEPGPEVRKARPRRDARGCVMAPARVRLSAATAPLSEGGAVTIPVEADFLSALELGDEIEMRDTRGRRRHLTVIETQASQVLATADRSIWFESGMPLKTTKRDGRRVRGRVGTLPAKSGALDLAVGDELLVLAETTRGRNAVRDAAGRVVAPAVVSCSTPSIVADARAGERISFDDGVIRGTIEAANPSRLSVRIQHVPEGGGRLKSDRGINLPDSALTLPALTPDDVAALDAATEFADIVGLSFVRSAADVEALQAELAARGAPQKIIVKIETARAFAELPKILFAALRHPPVGVMVARGDLGVEIGFERMAEVQEQILWLCEAAHVPVIWATQVLEGLTKTGTPTRGEVTDAAMAARAEAVMLNKGPYAARAIRFLDDVLIRMRDHHIKKTSMLRRLKVSEGRTGGAAALAEQSVL